MSFLCSLMHLSSNRSFYGLKNSSDLKIILQEKARINQIWFLVSLLNASKSSASDENDELDLNTMTEYQRTPNNSE